MCSTLLYNSNSTIDNDALNKLQVVTRLSEELRGFSGEELNP
jgi:hypothetical protein